MDPIPLSGTAIIENGNLLLLWKRKHNHYEFPGGKVDPGEDLETTARREAREEIGVELTDMEFVGATPFFHDGRNFMSHRFVARIKPGQTPRIMEPEIFRDIIWMPIVSFTEFSIAPNVKTFCERYLQGLYPDGSAVDR